MGKGVGGRGRRDVGSGKWVIERDEVLGKWVGREGGGWRVGGG